MKKRMFFMLLAVFAFIGKTLARSRQHRMVLTAFAALAVAVIFDSFASLALSRSFRGFSVRTPALCQAAGQFGAVTGSVLGLAAAIQVLVGAATVFVGSLAAVVLVRRRTPQAAPMPASSAKNTLGLLLEPARTGLAGPVLLR